MVTALSPYGTDEMLQIAQHEVVVLSTNGPKGSVVIREVTRCRRRATKLLNILIFIVHRQGCQPNVSTRRHCQ
jgi:hypothetical protein